MMWPVPLAGIADMLALVRPAGPMATPASHPYLQWCASGAAALALVCAHVGRQIRRPVVALLPAYFCGQSLRHLRAEGVDCVFYSLDADLLPDAQHIEALSAGRHIDMFVHVHYLGRVAGQHRSRMLADKMGAVLVEDCAHVMHVAGAQWLGDYLLFSPHKHFPVPQVGAALSRLPLPELPTEGSRWPLGWCLRQIARRLLGMRPRVPRWERHWSGQQVPMVPRAPHASVARAALHALAGASQAASRRRTHAARLVEVLAAVSGWRVLLQPDAPAAPYLLAMRCASATLARRRFALLNQRTQLVMQWPDLPSEIAAFPEAAGQAVDLVDSTLFFFVHQQINADAWLTMVKQIVGRKGF